MELAMMVAPLVFVGACVHIARKTNSYPFVTWSVATFFIEI